MRGQKSVFLSQIPITIYKFNKKRMVDNVTGINYINSIAGNWKRITAAYRRVPYVINEPNTAYEIKYSTSSPSKANFNQGYRVKDYRNGTTEACNY